MKMDEEIINEILMILKVNNLPSENTLYDRRDIVFYIQQLIDRVDDFYKDYESTIEDLENEKSGLDDKISKLEDELVDLRDEIEELQGENSDLKKEVDNLNDQIVDLERVL